MKKLEVNDSVKENIIEFPKHRSIHNVEYLNTRKNMNKPSIIKKLVFFIKNHMYNLNLLTTVEADYIVDTEDNQIYEKNNMSKEQDELTIISMKVLRKTSKLKLFKFILREFMIKLNLLSIVDADYEVVN
ncbi:MAG: hypothetical protein MJA82_14435 [Clostridia bacterium]|nr:hypothetical protein [Clostridia bacterium]